MRRILKRLQTPLPHQTGFNAADNSYTESEFLKICEDYRVPNDPMKYRDEKFYWSYQRVILSSQASARSGIVGNTASALTAQSAFLDNFENVVNRRVDIREDIKCYQGTLSYASSKVDYRMGQNIYMLPSDMNLKIKTGTVGYNNKILVSNEKFSLGKNDEVNLTVPAIKSHKVTQTAARPEPCKHNSNDVQVALVLFLAGGFAIWNIFR